MSGDFRRPGGGAPNAVRRPAHAGAFYPADPEALEALVDQQLAWADEVGAEGLATAGRAAGAHASAGEVPLGLLVPHAGLVYSGRVAAAAWRTLANAAAPTDGRTIVLVGTNHYVGRLRGLAVWLGGRWECPIGALTVDEAVAGRVVGLGPPFAADAAAHLQEHSLEVQLPFLVRRWATLPVVPILAGFRSRPAAEAAGVALGALLRDLRAAGREVVLVVSSDLVHYPAVGAAEDADRRLLAALAAMDSAALERLDEALLEADIPGLVCSLCGLDAVFFALAALRAMGATQGVELAAATSADVPFGDPGRVVGYGALAFR